MTTRATTTLSVVVDELIADAPAGDRRRDGMVRYGTELTRQLIATAPAGCQVRAVVPSVPDEAVDAVRELLPGVAEIVRLPLARRELAIAWQSGLPIGGVSGMLHAPSLLAPLHKRGQREEGDQVAVTIHDTLAWTHPQVIGARHALWVKSMAKRARRFADAIVVPTHAVADRLAEAIDFGDRIRVIGAAPATTLRVPEDADARAERMELPESYALTLGSTTPCTGVAALIRAVARPEAHDIPLLIAGPDRYGDGTATGVAAAAGLPEDRVRALGRLEDADLAVVLDRATLFVHPSLVEGFGLPLVEAFRFGLPIIHSDAPALVEIAAGAGLLVPRPAPNEADTGYSEGLAVAIGRVLDDAELRLRLSVLASDRARAFSWRDSAERVWALHADL